MGSLSKKLRKQVFQKTNNRCWYCGKKFRKSAMYKTVDHVDPNGNGDLSNLVPACKSCNTIKSDRDLETFREILSHKLDPNYVRFSDEQIAWLRRHGIELPERPLMQFYFEREEVLSNGNAK